MRHTRVTFELKRFIRADDPDFLKALHLYTKNIFPDWRTDTNEITYWLENFEKQFGDMFGIYGFYADDQLIGFAELVHLRAEHLVMIDYLVLDERHRKNNVFVQFIEHLQTLVETEISDVNYAIAEVGYLSRTSEPSFYSRTIIRLLKFVGFGVVKAPYVSPQLGFINLESQMNATLMLMRPNAPPPEEIGVQTYLAIVRAIYYKYYFRWYSIYDDRAGEYRERLDSLFGDLEQRLGNQAVIRINGAPYVDTGETTVKIREDKNVYVAYFAMLMFVATTFLLLSLRRFFEVDSGTLILIFIVSLVSFFSVMALYSPEAMQVFNRLLQFLKFWSKER